MPSVMSLMPRTEGRAGTEAARGYLQVLGVVLAVLNHQARHCGK